MEFLANHVKRLEYLTGLELYAVGGCVRNTLLKKPIKDYDFACKEDPDTIEASLKKMGKKIYAVGKRFGTLGFKDAELGLVEITTFRGENYIAGSRKPSVHFVKDLFQDLSRRDFSFNAIALDGDGKLHDYFNGAEDIENCTVKCVGNAADRFREDPLRILRAIRFAITCNFYIERETFTALMENSFLILNLSKERIINEISVMFAHDPIDSVAKLNEYRIFNVIFPELGYEPMYGGDKEYPTDLKTDDIDYTWKTIFKRLSHNLYATSSGRHYPFENIIYKDLVTKYSVHLKFSNIRRERLLEDDVPVEVKVKVERTTVE